MFESTPVSGDEWCVTVPWVVSRKRDRQIAGTMGLEELRTDLYRVLEEAPPEATNGDPDQAEEEGAMLGMVQFRDDRVVWASRDVGTFEGSAVGKFGRALFEAIAAQNDEDREPIQISTAVNSNPAFAVSSITLEFRGRTIVVCGADSLDSTPAPLQRAVTKLVVDTINRRLA